jgi:hypothetical protein
MTYSRRKCESCSTLDVLSEKVEANADQVAAIASQISKLADQVSQLTAALGVTNTLVSNLTNRLEALERRTNEQSDQREHNSFVINQNALGWLIALILVIVTAIINGGIRIGK